MLEIFVTYNDLCLNIDLLKEQIRLAEGDLEYWFGIKLNDRFFNGIPFGSDGVYKFGANTGLIQAEKTIDSLNKMNEKLEQMENARIRIKDLLSQFKGIEHKVAYKRYVEGKNLKEIAAELDYSYDYIREIMSRIKKQA
jgi:hypothetical protein